MIKAVNRYFHQMSIDGIHDQKAAERCTAVKKDKPIWKWIHQLYNKL
ncbi:hypothetical protein NIE88_21405 [Sporolactobacillus shoreicorticis]|uniref:Transposase n=1 Tax=Sporolactobacillus shoreicorticis TaxID=1923877 RepID=A0ABW5S2G8_9BACL|nr:hypothetical protein [Sporolactobacillus shoreicorticis]MCO7128287.1 hypothetical protein [Sporolactobacillus shoreicorticis]